MKLLFICCLFFFSTIAYSQYRFDNVKFNTVYWDELCKTLNQNPEHLILDVRSKGEYEDTSASKGLNIGHLKGAVNIDIRELGGRLKEIEAYKNKPVFVYCSHSQRSRRVSKMLADSGFAKIYNINGGVSNLRLFQFKEDCDLLTSNLPYQIVSPSVLTKANDYFVLDVRSDSAFKGISTVERRNAIGKLKSAVNIPLSVLEQNLSQLPKDKKILIVDEFGNDSPSAAELLNKNGFTNLFVLFDGLDGFLSEIPEKERNNWTTPASYHIINATAFDQLMKTNAPTVLDIRLAEDFSNTSKLGFRNIGNIKGAINIPPNEWDKQFASLPANKEKPVVVYGFGGSNEVYDAAKKLSAQGYKNVYVLAGGLFNIRWRAANIKGLEYLKDWVVNVPPDNQ